MSRYICIHGHFYQPPRENAWLEVIEQQDSAYPFHDWNERINSECYGPNAASRILNDDKQIVNIVNNYSRISFNFGPTLLTWLEENARDVYKSILEADKESLKLFNGHGSAIAQVYNHIIMPLANRKDKETQVIWGIRDFEHRFKRKPEGMWLAETAVDIETLEVLAENDIKFTILAPRQAASIKLMGSGTWRRVNAETIDTKQPYTCSLPSGKKISLFFYNGPLSQEVAFKGLLDNGKLFAERLTTSFDENNGDNQLIHIATDGESYGHHHKHGDMALSYCINHIEENNLAQITNYGQYLELHPPRAEATIHEDSSWSCVHGVERWRSNCGCHSGMHEGWHQQWREPLRKALDWLRDELTAVYQKEMSPFVEDIWQTRNDYIDILLSRKKSSVNRFVTRHTGKELTYEEKTRFIRFLEMQRHAMLMFTSCGWFFDEVSGIETTQIIQYANRAIQLAERESNLRLEDRFIALLKEAPSNRPEIENALMAYIKFVRPSRLTLTNVASHYAVASLFADFPEKLDICNYRGRSSKFKRLEAGNQILAIGMTEVKSIVTYSKKKFCYAVVYLGQNHIIGNMSTTMDEATFDEMMKQLTNSFNKSRISDVTALMQTYLGNQKFSLWSLFHDERIKVLNQVIEQNLEEAKYFYKKIYDNSYNLMNSLRGEDLSVPSMLKGNMEIVINNEMVEVFGDGYLHPSRLERLGSEIQRWGIELDRTQIAFAARERILKALDELYRHPNDIKLVTTIYRVLKTLKEIDISLNLWKIQNAYFRIAKKYLANREKPSSKIGKHKKRWMQLFDQIGDFINVEVV